MEKYSLALIITIAIILIVVFVFFFFPLKISSSPEACEIILENEGKKKIDIVFLVDNIKGSEVKEYSDFFLNSEPFSSNKEKFNFYYAGQSECEILKNLLFCYSKDLLKKASGCKNDYIVVLSDENAKIRSSAYMNVMSLNINHPPSVILHEFGHVFANLADEYVPSILPRGAKNCEKNCEKFEVIDGCFQGCCEDIYFRSSESSVMRTLSTSEYKKLNTLLIKRNLEKYE